MVTRWDWWEWKKYQYYFLGGSNRILNCRMFAFWGFRIGECLKLWSLWWLQRNIGSIVILKAQEKFCTTVRWETILYFWCLFCLTKHTGCLGYLWLHNQKKERERKKYFIVDFGQRPVFLLFITAADFLLFPHTEGVFLKLTLLFAWISKLVSRDAW